MSFQQYLPVTYQILYDYETQKPFEFTPLASYFLHGEARSGKTWLSLQYCKELIKGSQWQDFEAHKNIKIVRHFDLLDLAKKVQFADIGDHSRREYREIKEATVLIWDDFGSIKSSDFRDEIIFEIVDYRIMQGFPTVFTSNLNLKMVAEKYSDRVAGRIKDMCGENIFQVTQSKINFDQSKIDQMLNLSKMKRIAPVLDPQKISKDDPNFSIKNQTATFPNADQEKKISRFKQFMRGILKGASNTESKAFLIAVRTQKADNETYNQAFGKIELQDLFYKIQNETV